MRWNNTNEGGNPDIVLEIRDLSVEFNLPGTVVRAVRGLNLEVRKGRITALVGESGCGKSATALAVMGLLDANGRVSKGEIILNGRPVHSLRDRERRSCCGVYVGMVFQDPVNSLDPLFTVGEQVCETLREHGNYTRAQAKSEAIALLEHVQLSNAKDLLRRYPYELSGGMCQRVMIAVALALRPPLLIADEPTTALDVTIQAQILDYIRYLSREETGVLFITHDLGVVAEIADDISIMKDGEIVETGDVRQVFQNPQHVYTKLLLDAIL